MGKLTFMKGVVADEELVIKDEKTKSNSKSPFAYVDDFSEKKVAIEREEDLAGYDQFIINRFLSMGTATCDLALLASCTRNLTSLDHYRLMYSATPKRRLGIKWLNKKGGSSEEQKLVDDITDLCECGSNDARAMIDIMPVPVIENVIATAKELRRLRDK